MTGFILRMLLPGSGVCMLWLWLRRGHLGAKASMPHRRMTLPLILTSVFPFLSSIMLARTNPKKRLL